jgi:hypothetical protein
VKTVGTGAYNHPWAASIGAVGGTGVLSTIGPNVLSEKSQEAVAVVVSKSVNATTDFALSQLEKGATILTDKVAMPIIEKGFDYGLNVTIKIADKFTDKVLIPGAEKVMDKGGELVNKFFGEVLIPNANKVINEVVIPNGEKFVDAGVDLTLKFGKQLALTGYESTLNALPSYQDVQEVIWKKPPSNAIGPVELLTEKVQETLQKTSEWLDATKEQLPTMNQTLAFGSIIVVTGTLAFMAYRKRQALLATCKRLMQNVFTPHAFSMTNKQFTFKRVF